MLVAAVAAAEEEDEDTFILDATRCRCEPVLEESALPPLLRAGTAPAPNPRHAEHRGFLPLKLPALKLTPQALQVREHIVDGMVEGVDLGSTSKTRRCRWVLG